MFVGCRRCHCWGCRSTPILYSFRCFSQQQNTWCCHGVFCAILDCTLGDLPFTSCSGVTKTWCCRGGAQCNERCAVCPQVFGNAWTWCEDFFSALPGGYGVHAYYDDFSSPCYDGQHSVIMGGSFMSTGDEASRFARFHFRCGLFYLRPDNLPRKIRNCSI